MKLFWTHGGNLGLLLQNFMHIKIIKYNFLNQIIYILGTIEAVHCGKPCIITPFYGDQYLNAAALSERGFGFRLNILEITADKIYELVNKSLHPQYVIWNGNVFFFSPVTR